MQERVKNFGRDLLARWNSLERSQKIKIGVTVAVLLITLFATIYITTRPKWVVIVNNKSFTETGLIENALNAEGIATKLIDNSTGVSIKEQDQDRALIVLSDNTALSSMEFTFQDALDASGMGSTERVKEAAFQRLFISDLNRKLALYDWVDTASVDIVPPDENNFFVKSDERPTASVLLYVNRTPNDVQAANVARLIARSVKGMSMDDIEITDQNAQTIYSGMQKSAGTSGAEQDIERQRNSEMDAQVRKVLLPMYNEVRTIPNLKLNWSKTESEERLLNPPVADSTEGVPLERYREEQSVVNGVADEEPGLMPNDNATTTYQTGTPLPSEAESEIRKDTFGYNETVIRTNSGVGEVILNESSLGVWVYKYRHYYQEYMEENDLLGGQTWEQFMEATMFTETPIAIDQNVVDSLRIATGIQNLSVIGFEVPVFHDYEQEPVKIEQYIIFGILALLILLLAYGLIRRTQKDEVIELEPELTVEDLIVSTQLEEEEEEEEEINLADIVSEPESKLQIDKFIEERPEVVALLLRNWLNDEWE